MRARSRLLSTLTAICLVSGVAIGSAGCGSDESVDPVRSLVGEQVGLNRYRVDFKERVVGDYQARTEATADGLRISSRLRVTLPKGALIDIEETLQFAAQAPFELRSASRVRRSGQSEQNIRIALEDGAYRTVIDHDAQRQTHIGQWNYNLADHLHVELWLRESSPSVGATVAARQLDFDRLTPTQLDWRLLDRQADGSVALGLVDDTTSSVFQLGPDLVPEAFHLAGSFTMTRVDDPVPIPSLGPVVHTHLAMVPLAKPLTQPARVKDLHLGINDAAALALAGAVPVTGSAGNWQLHLESQPPSFAAPDDLERNRRPTANLPANDPAVRRLARRVVRDASSDMERIQHLNRFVHRYLDYQVDVRSVSLLDTLASRVGDCTEFADLLTTLARATGLAARTVTGLAYAETEGPGFYLHAWTEIAANGRWLAVDPTFGYPSVGPIHIPFPAATNQYLRAYSTIPDMAFSVIRANYLAEGS